MTNRRGLYGGAAMAVALSCYGANAHAAAAAAGAEAAGTISELIVTAEKRSERL